MSRLAAHAMLGLLLAIAVTATARAEIGKDAGLRGQVAATRDEDAGVAPPSAELRREGAWPDDERVTLKLEAMPRAEAIRKLADEAGWSVIVRGVGSEPVDVRVSKQPAARVLELILAGDAFVAKREGTMIAIAPAADVAPIDARGKRGTPNAPAVQPPPPPAPPAPPTPSPGPARRAEDRLVTAGNAVIGADQVVGNLTVLAGDVEVYGTVSKDLAVYAGNVRVRKGAHVQGDINAVAGEVQIDEGAQVDGFVGGVAADVQRGDRGEADEADEDEDDDESEHAEREAAREEMRQAAEQAREAARKARRWARDRLDHPQGVSRHAPDEGDEDEDEDDPRLGMFARVERAGSAVARSALLFAFGAVLLALAGTRVQRMQAEVAARPVHALIVGGVSMALGLVALIVTTVTIIGIPLAVVAGLLSVIGVYVGICAALTALGRALLHARTPSAYLHLALGCALYLLASSLPGIGTVVTLAVTLIGFGALVRTRVGGLFSRWGPPPAPPPASPSTELGPQL